MLTLISVIFYLLSICPISPVTCPKTSVTTMALSLEDFLKISKEQRREEQELRAQERASDLKEINKMIEKGVKDEVERVLVPIQAKNDERFTRLEAAMTKIQGCFKDPTLPHPGTAHPPHPPITPRTTPHSVSPAVVPSGHILSDDVQETLRRVKRIISLQPILKRRDVDRQIRTHDHIKNDAQAMEAAVREYFREELKCQSVPTIVSIFPPANTPDYDRLYVEFEDETTASYMAGHARVIRKQDHQVSIYVPRNFQQRFRAFNDHAKKLRTAPGLLAGDIKTKVIYGWSDFILLTKPRNGRWTSENIDTSTFPPFQSTLGPAPATSSPPPGRPRGSPSPPPNPARPAMRGSQSPPPSEQSKRAASSPLENQSKAAKSSEPSILGELDTTPVPTTPPYTPSLAARKVSAEDSCPETTCTPSKRSENQPEPGSVKSVLSLHSPDTGKFAQTAVCSPSQSNNTHFTFNTRRMSLPAVARQTLN